MADARQVNDANEERNEADLILALEWKCVIFEEDKQFGKQAPTSDSHISNKGAADPTASTSAKEIHHKPRRPTKRSIRNLDEFDGPVPVGAPTKKRCTFNRKRPTAMPNEAAKKNILTKGLCDVCQCPSTGNHYGIACCEGCKGFFKWQMRMVGTFKCHGNWKCAIQECKACHLKACKEAGMQANWNISNFVQGDKDNVVNEAKLDDEQEWDMIHELERQFLAAGGLTMSGQMDFI